MATLKEIVYEKILSGDRVSSYIIYQEYWYVIKWNQQTYIHYTAKTSFNKITFLWYLSASIEPAKFMTENKLLTTERRI